MRAVGTRTLGHLLAVHKKETVGLNTSGPLILREHSNMVVDPEGKVVRDKVLTRDTEVNGIPVATQG